MFLNLLKQDEQKKLFMQLANVLALSDGITSTPSEDDKEANDLYKSLYGGFGAILRSASNSETWKKMKGAIGDSEVYMLELFAAELGLFSQTQSNLSAWQNESFISEFEPYLKKAIKQVSQDPDAKKKVMLSLAESDIDLTSVDQAAIEEELLKLGELRANVFGLVSKTFIDESKVSLSASEKKAIVFELIGIAFADNDFSELELATVRNIAQSFEIDSDTLDEMTQLVAELNRVSTEALDLIQE
ncbi:TerB family tellurite resistance protein [Vibrio rotiferianus]|uniref:TerB family tellurite resistance protein n=1 Tax=Vibrio rotiferianus TaxID=190895 RepID=UPI0015F3EDAD|nr:TerB family tellurite resistance protein [Vibrio rotiferianus]